MKRGGFIAYFRRRRGKESICVDKRGLGEVHWLVKGRWWEGLAGGLAFVVARK